MGTCPKPCGWLAGSSIRAHRTFWKRGQPLDEQWRELGPLPVCLVLGHLELLKLSALKSEVVNRPGIDESSLKEEKNTEVRREQGRKKESLRKGSG